jgi:hypothetical protein
MYPWSIPAITGIDQGYKTITGIDQGYITFKELTRNTCVLDYKVY